MAEELAIAKFASSKQRRDFDVYKEHVKQFRASHGDPSVVTDLRSERQVILADHPELVASITRIGDIMAMILLSGTDGENSGLYYHLDNGGR